MIRKSFAASFIAVALAAVPLVAQPRPDLVVVISIDQFAYRYVDRLAPYFAEKGFNRFLKRGADFTNADYPYSSMFTGPGHASIGTGWVPARSGIVANRWLDRFSGRMEYCVEDHRAKPILGGRRDEMSPMNLDSDSLGDELLEQSPGSKVYGVAIKDRAAILMAGRRADAAYWFDSSIPGFTTTTYYPHADRALLDRFNSTVPEFVHDHPVWNESSFIPKRDQGKVTFDPPALRKYKTNAEGLGVSFPHPISGVEALISTPFGNELVLNFAESLIRKEKLGTEDGAPDLVYVGLSSPDYLGHDFGPDSLEAADDAVRVDRDLQRFLEDLDMEFGDRYTVVITADHGIQSIPEVARALGRDAGRVSLGNPRRGARTIGDLPPSRRELEKIAARLLGRKLDDASPIGEALIRRFDDPGVFLDWAEIHRAGLDGERVKRAIRAAAMHLKGVRAAFTNSQLLAMNPHPSDLEKEVRRSFRADRSPDVIVILRNGYIWNAGGTGTTHGQPVEADQHVPLLLWGRGIKAGVYRGRVSPLDIAKSIGKLLGVDAGGTSTIVLPCIE